MSSTIRLIYQKLRFTLKQLSYRQVWNGLASEKPMDAVLTGTESEKVFDEKGKLEAEWLQNLIPNNSRVLDVGCGIGRLEKFLAPHCLELHAVDVSPNMIRIATKRLQGTKNVFLKVGDSSNLSEYSAEFFDVVISMLVLQHMDQEDAFRSLLEFNRVLKKNGICIVQFPDLHSEFYFNTFLHCASLPPHRRSIARARCYTSDEVQFKMEKAGFLVDEILKRSPEMYVIATKKHSAMTLTDLKAHESI